MDRRRFVAVEQHAADERQLGWLGGGLPRGRSSQRETDEYKGDQESTCSGVRHEVLPKRREYTAASAPPGSHPAARGVILNG